MGRFKWALLLLWLLNAYDAAITIAITARWGSDVEGNPVMRAALEQGVWVFVAVKLLA